MFIHVFFMFPETSQKLLEDVEDIFVNERPGSLKYIGTPAWKTHVSKSRLGDEEDKGANNHVEKISPVSTQKVVESKTEATDI